MRLALIKHPPVVPGDSRQAALFFSASIPRPRSRSRWPLLDEHKTCTRTLTGCALAHPLLGCSQHNFTRLSIISVFTRNRPAAEPAIRAATPRALPTTELRLPSRPRPQALRLTQAPHSGISIRRYHGFLQENHGRVEAAIHQQHRSHVHASSRIRTQPAGSKTKCREQQRHDATNANQSTG